MISNPPGKETSELGRVSGELTSWKEIAHYLGVHMRTAQTWERTHGLPVRRTFGRRSRVSAFRAEVDAWTNRLATPASDRESAFSWPLGPTLNVQVRFSGGPIEPAHLELLQAYLDLFKKTLA
jgi:excisionase family DNA binding protein